MNNKISVNLHLGGWFSMMVWLFLNEETSKKRVQKNKIINEYVLKPTQGTK